MPDPIRSNHARILILAGAGTGKTHTLTARLAHLVKQGVAPHRIRLVTFTNRAAREMIERTTHLLGHVALEVRAGTFHALAYRDLARHGTAIGLPSRITVCAEREATTLFARVAPDLPSPKRVLDALSRAIDGDRSIEDVLRRTAPDLARLASIIDAAAERFAEAKAERGLLDFDDLLVAHRLLLDAVPEIAAGTDHVLVDEYQDTSVLQAAIAERLAEGSNLCVVGDDAQSIFSFRGAHHENILRFADGPDTEVHRRTQCFRCQPAILDIANAAIRSNRGQHEKTLVTDRPRGHAAAVIEADSEAAEAHAIADQIRTIESVGIPYDEIAVLFRARKDADALPAALSSAHIPFSMRGGARTVAAAELEWLASVLRLIRDVGDDDAWRFVLTAEDGIGARTVDRVLAARNAVPGASPSRVLRRVSRARPLALKFDAIEASNDVVAKAIEVFGLDVVPPSSTGVDAVIAELALASGDLGTNAGVTLSTVHQAKGLEWRAVFVMRMVDGAFPHEAALGDPEAIEEERRLLHVAVTRAKDRLFLTRPTATTTPAGRIPLSASRFLKEVELS